MCGISGILSEFPLENISKLVLDMNQRLIHRGPDAAGQWTDKFNTVSLGHRRLSILGLGKSGNQPMFSKCGRFIIIFNGEIYNYKEIKKILSIQNLVSSSDTEVLLEAISKIGVQETLKIINGMFAFALWDRKRFSITLARDRMGEKPLFYSLIDNKLIFASELKSITKGSGHRFDICPDALSLYFQNGYVPGPKSIYKKVYKLLPGHLIEFSKKDLSKSKVEISSKPFWELRTSFDASNKEFYIQNPHQAVADLQEMLGESVKKQMISDVPIGSFLSGGIDSSLVTALMQQNSMKPINTFSIGFHDKSFNEAHHAKNVANFLGTNHTEHYVSSEEAFNVIPKLASIYDEPFADPSQIPTFLISKVARQKVTVALSGDGGDELFGGYNRHIFINQWDSFERFPYSLRKTLGWFLNLGIRLKVFNALENIDSKNLLPKGLESKVSKLSNRLIDIDDSFDLIRSLSMLNDSNNVVLNHVDPSQNEKFFHKFENFPGSLLEKMTYLDAMKYLPDNILVKVDRASMANSLETRAPFLDYEVVQFAFGLPDNLRISKGNSKLILRKILYDLIPRSLLERPKMGFGVPVGLWIQDSLRDWAHSLLTTDKLNECDLLNTKLIQERWYEHREGIANWDLFLWNVLMFMLWLDEQ